MQQDLLSETINEKLHKSITIIIATFFGGPLAAAFLLVENFKNLNRVSFISKTWLIAIGVLLFTFAVEYIPIINKIPSIAFNIGMLVLVNNVIKSYQPECIAHTPSSTSTFYSGWRACAVALIGVLITAFMFVAIPSFLFGENVLRFLPNQD